MKALLVSESFAMINLLSETGWHENKKNSKNIK